MNVALPKTPLVSRMTVAEFLAWPTDPTGATWQLIDGEPVAMAPASDTHGSIQSEIGGLLGNHLLEHGLPCRVVTTPGVTPRVRADWNVRVPDLAVTCRRNDVSERLMTEPMLVIEILSPGNEAETWSNVWTYTTIPSVQEILVVRSIEIGAELLHRQPDGTWPADFERIASPDGRVRLDSVGAEFVVTAFYRTTELGQAPA